ncbi:hypothetical protein [Actinoplanes teichomyceticus]|uniref:hypothetical protein n=1 Tax=Actinoplanes teichomyceticus TaxID=1867 RepID=UPI000F0A7230|nr:hypothetical protein [Actinoplanes teichomyceticus]GIF12458.1 hypothetical protein Ate01nite_24900 [Actinoplanes teichomyceticus]
MIAEHDELATHTVAGTAFYLEELERRERRRSAEASDRLGRKAFWLGVSNTVLALVAAVAAIIALFK